MIVETKGLRVDLSRAVWKKSVRSGGRFIRVLERGGQSLASAAARRSGVRRGRGRQTSRPETE